jgi:hypothetical protein
MTQSLDPRLKALVTILDTQTGRYDTLRHVQSFGEYLAAPVERSDEESLTEPVLALLLESVLGFPADQYVPQYSKSGLKPDLTPRDLIAHPFVLDAKATDQKLTAHIPQIRAYVEQRSLTFGVLFNLAEVAVFRRGAAGFDPELSFKLLPLWRFARGEALAAPELDAFFRFCDTFRYREMDFAAKVAHVRTQDPWSSRLAKEPQLTVDVEFLVDQLRKLSRELADDAGSQQQQLADFLAFNPARGPRLRDELRLLAIDLDPSTDPESLPDDPLSWPAAGAFEARVWRQYLLRVAYLGLTRVLLYRAWEDVDFVKSYLYNGGFDRAFDELNENAREVLQEAFAHGAERYRWLFGGDSNYDWYRPQAPVLVDILYLLAPIPLGRLDADVLGGLYVSYVDEIDRDRLGQFFTPRPVVRFMLDRAGFRGSEVFAIEGDDRKPLRVLDFATGSGGFLVEAARRVIDEGTGGETAADLRDALTAIVAGFVGGEISPFPYYLTEINLLLQVSRILGRLRVLDQTVPPFVLGALHVDTLMAKSDSASSLENLEAVLRADSGELATRGFDLVPLDGEKRETFRRMREDGGFDLVVGNPPYVAEANNKPLFDHFRSISAWKDIYRGKTDYLYYFLWLAAEKLAPGGRMCVITPAGWMNAGSADFLREKLASELRLDELFLFGSYRLFAADQGPAPTPTVESAILVATKAPTSPKHKLRVVALEDETDWSDRQALLDEMQKRAKAKPGRKAGLHQHDLVQAELRPEWPWPIKVAVGDIGARVVKHLQSQLDAEKSHVEPLGHGWKVFQGIQTAADAYSKRIQRRLSVETKAALANAGAAVGDPILELPPGAEKKEPWVSHQEMLARSPEPRAVLYGAIDDEDYTSIVVLRPDPEPPPEVIAALEPWKAVLETRAEIMRNRRHWWETAWPRAAADMSAPKIIALYRTDRGRFALDETGEWQPSIKSTLAVGREPGAPVAYLCALLNSELLDLWYAVRGKAPRDVWRNYEPLRMNQMPYRRPEGDERVEQIAQIVRAIAANRRALLPHRRVIGDLGRTVKDPWKTGPNQVDHVGLLETLPASATVSVRLDSSLTVEEKPAGRPKRTGPGVLEFRRGKKTTGRVLGASSRLDLLERFVGPGPISDAGTVLLPKNDAAFEALIAARQAEVASLLSEGRQLVEEAERLVCAMYGLDQALTDEVVAHADARAAASEPAE